MNAETRAKEIAAKIVSAIYESQHYSDFAERAALSVTPAIAQAIRQAENDKLEEAACAATAAGHLWAKEDRDPTRAGCGAEIAKLIRSLKSKDTP